MTPDDVVAVVRLFSRPWSCGTSIEERTIADAVRYLAKAWQQTSMTDAEIDEVDAYTKAIVEGE